MPADVPRGPVASGDAGGSAGTQRMPSGSASPDTTPTAEGQTAPAPGRAGQPGSGVRAAADPGNGATGTADPGPPARAGRNLPAALGVGIGLGAVALVTLFTVKVLFLAVIAIAVGVALWELSRALQAREIRLPLVPVMAGGAAALALAYWRGENALLGCLGLTVIAILAWRLGGGTRGYLRDVTAGMFALAYLPLMASFVVLMLTEHDGPRRTVVFLILGVCSDVGGYFAGVLVGRHLMAPVISPKKTWEGFAGSAVACLLAGGIALPTLLHGAVWQGVLVGAAALAAATLGDLTESMIKRDLGIKDMGRVLPGHGGVLDRIDSLLIAAPVVWLLLAAFIPAHPS